MVEALRAGRRLGKPGLFDAWPLTQPRPRPAGALACA